MKNSTDPYSKKIAALMIIIIWRKTNKSFVQRSREQQFHLHPTLPVIISNISPASRRTFYCKDLFSHFPIAENWPENVIVRGYTQKGESRKKRFEQSYVPSKDLPS